MITAICMEGYVIRRLNSTYSERNIYISLRLSLQVLTAYPLRKESITFKTWEMIEGLSDLMPPLNYCTNGAMNLTDHSVHLWLKHNISIAHGDKWRITLRLLVPVMYLYIQHIWPPPRIKRPDVDRVNISALQEICSNNPHMTPHTLGTSFSVMEARLGPLWGEVEIVDH